MPKDTPILFTGEMVRAILDGRKAQTRRLIKSPSRKHDHFTLVDYGDGFWPYLSDDGESSITDDGHETAIECPYGQPGDRLWVRETWQVDAPRDGTWPDTCFFGCRNAPLSWIPGKYRTPGHCLFRATWTGSDLWWRPSIHMPKWACRLWLELTDVRVERLQEISQADAIAEGAPPSHPSIDLVSRDFGYPDFSRSWYAQLWESINGEGSWAANPWVWVLTFKRVER